MKSLLQQRKELLGSLKDTPLDLVIVGGGITGAGCLRDAALRGLKTALFEKNDFGSGTSSRSSKLIHGGLRYLETYDWRLVFEASRERQLLLRLAPKIVQPLPFLLPIYNQQRRGLSSVAAGMWLYDLLSGFQNVRRPKIRLREKTIAYQPLLRQEGLVGSAQYFDSITHDVQLTMANIQSAWRNAGLALNHVRVSDLQEDNGKVVGVRLKDELDGSTYEVRSRWVLNVTGPWSDHFLEQKIGKKENRLRLTKGAHLVLPRTKLPITHAVLMLAPSDGRVTFLIPWEGVTLLGTTDTDFKGNPDHVVADKTDVEYLLEVGNYYFPQSHLTPKDVISTFAGLRPLLADDHAQTSKVSREHRIILEKPGLATLVGGKLTTYRKMAEEMVDWLITHSPEWTTKFKKCATRSLPLDEIEMKWNENNLDQLITKQMALTVSDVLARRSSLPFLDRSRGLSFAPKVGNALIDTVGYDKETISNQLREYLSIVRDAQSGID